MPTPATAPPSVIDFSCGTTARIVPRERRLGEIGEVVIPSASTGPPTVSDATTASKWLRSISAARAARGRETGSTCASRVRTPACLRAAEIGEHRAFSRRSGHAGRIEKRRLIG
jgi:hypothetical protein